MRYYSSHAKALYEKYRRLDAEALHESWLAHLPESPGLACDAAMPQSRQPLSWNAPHERAFQGGQVGGMDGVPGGNRTRDLRRERALSCH